MFDALTDRLSGIFRGLRGRGKIAEESVGEAKREIRAALTFRRMVLLRADTEGSVPITAIAMDVRRPLG